MTGLPKTERLAYTIQTRFLDVIAQDYGIHARLAGITPVDGGIALTFESPGSAEQICVMFETGAEPDVAVEASPYRLQISYRGKDADKALYFVAKCMFDTMRFILGTFGAVGEYATVAQLLTDFPERDFTISAQAADAQEALPAVTLHDLRNAWKEMVKNREELQRVAETVKDAERFLQAALGLFTPLRPELTLERVLALSLQEQAALGLPPMGKWGEVLPILHAARRKQPAQGSRMEETAACLNVVRLLREEVSGLISDLDRVEALFSDPSGLPDYPWLRERLRGGALLPADMPLTFIYDMANIHLRHVVESLAAREPHDGGSLRGQLSAQCMAERMAMTLSGALQAWNALSLKDDTAEAMRKGMMQAIQHLAFGGLFDHAPWKIMDAFSRPDDAPQAQISDYEALFLRDPPWYACVLLSRMSPDMENIRHVSMYARCVSSLAAHRGALESLKSWLERASPSAPDAWLDRERLRRSLDSGDCAKGTI